jgi:thymidine kinase
MAKLFLRYAAMNAGKSTYLLQVAHNYREIGKPVLLLTSALDDRAGLGVISSRIGLRQGAHTYDRATDFEQLLSRARVACVLVDEAQFLTAAQARQLHRWVHLRDTPVMCFAIRTDFAGNPFEGSAALLALAEDVEEIKTVCACGRKATMNMRLDERGQRVREGPQILIGDNDRYRQVCAKCFYLDPPQERQLS